MKREKIVNLAKLVFHRRICYAFSIIKNEDVFRRVSRFLVALLMDDRIDQKLIHFLSPAHSIHSWPRRSGEEK